MRAVLVLLLVFAVLSDASLSRQTVKEGERVEVSFKEANVIKRHVAAGTQYYHFDGPNKGSFVDEQGNKIDSSNFEGKDGVLIVKNFTKADVGSYSRHPNEMIRKKDKDVYTAVVGPTHYISIE
uniref:CPR type cuticle protein n=1 Tax=Caenorhabditis tropicalis TaxID=1561998 RepID=A0A1I7UGS2_9PELO